MKITAFFAAVCAMACGLMASSVIAAQSSTSSNASSYGTTAQNLNTSEHLRLAYWDGRHRGHYTRSHWCQRNPHACQKRWCQNNPRACHKRWCKSHPQACRAKWCNNHPRQCRW